MRTACAAIYAVRDKTETWKVDKKTGQGEYVVDDPGIEDKRLFILDEEFASAFRFVKYLNDNPNATYDDLSADAGVTKARVCQMIALCKRLPTEITQFLMDAHEPEILNYFTERRLRPLTLLASDEDKIKKFDEMMEAFSTG